MKNSMKRYIVGNWKMNPEDLGTAKDLVSDIKRKISGSKKNIVVICPPSIFFSEVKGKTPAKKIKFGLQNVHFEKSGSFTGEISVLMAKDLKAEFIIVGHSERRAMGEDDNLISQKVSAVLRAGITPILCIGEKEVDEQADYLEFVRNQLVKGLSAVGSQDVEKIIIAYEPVYAIGATKAVPSHEIYQRNIFVKKVLTDIYGKQKAFSVPILYGGTVTVDNCKEIIRDGSVDGFLIGRASLSATDFTEIVKRVEKI